MRLEAAGLFAAGVRPPQAAKQLRVLRKSACAWHQAWSLAGTEALLSKGPGGRSCRLSDGHMQRLEAALDAGPAAYGWSEDFARLLDAAQQQLGVPIVLVWDNLTTHKDALMRSLIAARPWLTVFYLPAYPPELNPVETVWSHLKRGVRNLAACTRPARRDHPYPA